MRAVTVLMRDLEQNRHSYVLYLRYKMVMSGWVRKHQI